VVVVSMEKRNQEHGKGDRGLREGEDFEFYGLGVGSCVVSVRGGGVVGGER